MNCKKILITNPSLSSQCISNDTRFHKLYPFSNNNSKINPEEAHKCPECGLDYNEHNIEVSIVESVEKCANCNSIHIEKISKPNADLKLYFCKQCRCYMGVDIY